MANDYAVFCIYFPMTHIKPLYSKIILLRLDFRLSLEIWNRIKFLRKSNQVSEILQISVWLLQAHRLHQTWWLLVHSKVTLIQRFWLDEISHYLYVHWSNRNRIHVILFIDFVRKGKWNHVNTSFNQTISNFTECQVTA